MLVTSSQMMVKCEICVDSLCIVTYSDHPSYSCRMCPLASRLPSARQVGPRLFALHQQHQHLQQLRHGGKTTWWKGEKQNSAVGSQQLNTVKVRKAEIMVWTKYFNVQISLWKAWIKVCFPAFTLDFCERYSISSIIVIQYNVVNSHFLEFFLVSLQPIFRK